MIANAICQSECAAVAVVFSIGCDSFYYVRNNCSVANIDAPECSDKMFRLKNCNIFQIVLAFFMSEV